MLAITGGKGGTGKTITTLGLARSLDTPTLAVDADWDLPDLHSLAGVERSWDRDCRRPEHREARVAPGPDSERASDSGRDGVAGLSRAVSGVDPSVRVLPAPTDPTSHDRRAVLERCRTTDRPVLVDCPAGAGPDAVEPLRVADGALLTVTPCGPAIRDAAKTAAMAEAVGTPVVGVVVTRTSVVPPDLCSVFDTESIFAIPSAEPPVLHDERVQSVYESVGAALDTSGGVIDAAE